MRFFWKKYSNCFKKYWNLSSDNSVLDVGCGKGFMLYDFLQLIQGIKLKGIDISEYAIKNSLPEVKNLIQVANAKKLPFPDNSFDFVISINTVHNLEKSECAKALKEISRVCKKNAFITVDAFNNEEEKNRMYAWNLTAKTILSTDQWIELFEEVGYTGDYFWFTP